MLLFAYIAHTFSAFNYSDHYQCQLPFINKSLRQDKSENSILHDFCKGVSQFSVKRMVSGHPFHQIFKFQIPWGCEVHQMHHKPLTEEKGMQPFRQYYSSSTPQSWHYSKHAKEEKKLRQNILIQITCKLHINEYIHV